MLKPVTLLALDDESAQLAAAVQQRIAAACGVDELAQAATPGGNLDAAIAAIHARRQAPDSALRARDDVANRELVLVVISASAESRTTLIDTAREIRLLYDRRRYAAFYSVEALVLLPELVASPDYGAAYSLLKMLSAENPFDAVWLLDATNGNRVKFGPVTDEAYAIAVAGSLLFEPEMSGAPAAHRPRGFDPAFSAFGYAELVFPRDVALQRLEPRLAAELIRERLLSGGGIATDPRLAAKQFVLAEEFAAPLGRIGVEAGQSLFRRFQAKTLFSDKSRSADELIAAVRSELQAHRDAVHLQNLATLDAQSNQTATAFAAIVARTTDETLDRHGYDAAIALGDALLDPLPDLHEGALAPRNLVTEINSATAALDARLQFMPNTVTSDASRKRVRALDTLIADQQLVADVLTPERGADKLAEMQAEKESLLRRLPDLIFNEETENNAARNAAREAEAVRLAGETSAREQQLRELFDRKPAAERALAEALEARRAFLLRHFLWAVVGAAALAVVCWYAGISFRALPIGLTVFAVYTLFRYVTTVVPYVRAMREALEQLLANLDGVDKAKNAAHNDELQFEYDVAHRRATISVLRRTREVAGKTLVALRARREELQALAAELVPASITAHRLSIAMVEDADVDAWYEGTREDRKHLFREFPIARSESSRLPIGELRSRVTTYAAAGFEHFAKMTLADAATLLDDALLNQRLKRFAQYSAPLIELRDDDLPAQQTMQRDTTLFCEPSLLSLVQKRLPDAQVRESSDRLRIHAVSRVLHYPAYVIGQIEYYRSEYDAARHGESVAVADPLPQVAPVLEEILEFRED